MSTVYSGDPSSVTTPLSATVIDATNASPIVVRTSAAHLYATHDVVTITGVAGNTAANGTWTITVVDSTHFSLDGSTGSGAYVSGGTAVDNSLTPQFQIPSDGDDLDAASINAALEALADRTQFLALVGVVPKVDTFDVSGTWTCPPGVTSVDLEGSGGGGGGGSGASVTAGTSTYEAAGGSGGGGAIFYRRTVSVTPGTTYTVHIGGGGAGGSGAGSGGGNGSRGADGGDTTFDTLATFAGGGGGNGGDSNQDTAVDQGSVSLPGPPVNGLIPTLFAATSATTLVMIEYIMASLVSQMPQAGGAAGTKKVETDVSSGSAWPGVTSPQGYDGGNGAASGATNTYHGGGGGGGGGAGSAGNGGNGGVGGDGGVSATAGTPGSSAAANTGAGGGGGGGGGGKSASTPAGGAGGNGGSGYLRVKYFGPKAATT